MSLSLKSRLLQLCTAIEKKNADEIRSLIKKLGGYEIENKIPKDCDGHTPLHKVAKFCADKEILKLFTETEEIDLNVKDNHGCTALHYVIERENFEEAQILIEAGADIIAPNKDGKTPLHVLIDKRVNKETIESLINLKNRGGENSLFEAVRAGNVKIINFLINYGCDIKCVSSDGSTILHHAALRTIQVAELLLNAGADVHVKDKEGQTPLFSAVRSRNDKIVQLLLDRGSDINTVDKQGWTVLHQATSINRNDNNFSTVELLLKNGVNVNAQDENGSTPLHYLMNNRNNAKTRNLFLNYKPKVNVKNNDGKSPLLTAIEVQDVKTVELLTYHGSDVNCLDKYKKTPLHYAAYYYEVSCKILKCCLKNVVDADAHDSEGRTALLIFLQKPGYRHDFDKTLQFMLKYTDVNKIDQTKKEHLSFIRDKTWKIVLKHLAKLKALELPINPAFENSISNRAEFSDYFSKCLEELTLAKSTKIKDCWVTFFNLLVDDRKKLKNYAGNFCLIAAFKQSDCVKNFPIYGPSMKKNVKKGIERRKLYDKCAGVLSNNWPIFGPTHLIIRDILDCCLSTKDLSKFLKE